MSEATAVAPDVLKLAGALLAAAGLGAVAHEPPRPARVKPYKVREIAKILDVHPTTVYREIGRGRLVAERVGVGRGVMRVAVEEFAKYRALLVAAASQQEDGSNE